MKHSRNFKKINDSINNKTYDKNIINRQDQTE